MASNPHFPDLDASAPPPAGHNNPPLDEQVRIDFKERLYGDNPEFRAKLDDLLAASDRVEVYDDDTLGRAGDLDVSLRDAEKLITDTHKEVKEPYLAATRAVDGEKRSLIELITDAREKVRRRSNKYLNEREARRRAAAERIAAQQRKEAAEAAAAQALRDEAAASDDAEAMEQVPVIAAPVAMPEDRKIKSDTGVTVSGRTVVKTAVDDYVAAFAMVQGDEKVRAAIDAAVQRLARAGLKSIPGTRVWEEQAMATRG